MSKCKTDNILVFFYFFVVQVTAERSICVTEVTQLLSAMIKAVLSPGNRAKQCTFRHVNWPRRLLAFGAYLGGPCACPPWG